MCSILSHIFIMLKDAIQIVWFDLGCDHNVIGQNMQYKPFLIAPTAGKKKPMH